MSLRAWLSRPVAMVVVALVLRLAVLTLGHTYRMSRDENFGFGWETGRIARSIAAGEGFSAPFRPGTGPTAWVAPVYPYLVAGVFRITGIYTPASAWILLALNSLFSALTCWTLYSIALHCFGLRVARWTGWTWALLPYSIYWAVRWVWETSFTAFLLSAAFLVALRLARSWALRDWAAAGALWGVIALSNPTCLSLLPFFLGRSAWELRNHGPGVTSIGTNEPSGAPSFPQSRSARRGKGGIPSVGTAKTPVLLRVATALVVVLASVAPWLARNHAVFGEFVFIRSNLGAELRMGNSPQSDGLWMWWIHPSQSPAEFAKYAQLGELAYVQQRGAEAVDFIAHNPGRFAYLCLRRLIFYWIGTPRTAGNQLSTDARHLAFLASSLLAFWGLWLAIRHRSRGWFLFAALLVVFPLPYYITFPHPRYRAPIEPEMVILGLYLLAQALPERREQPAA